MQKKIKIVLSIIIILIIAFLIVWFFGHGGYKKNNKINKNYYLILNCESNNIKVGETTSCTLKGYSKENISLVEGKLLSNSNLEITNIVKDSKWVIGSDDSNLQLIGNEVKGKFNIVTFDVKALKKGKGILNVKKLKKELSFTSKDMKTYSLDELSYNINVK